jgi:hypothetical protein
MDQSASPRIRLPPGRRRQCRSSIVIAFAGRQDGIRGCGIWTLHQPRALTQSRKASQWIAATIFDVTSGSEKKARNSAAAVRLCRVPMKLAASRGPSRLMTGMRRWRWKFQWRPWGVDGLACNGSLAEGQMKCW